jgi:putative aldouronate transport system substrate-binding protein
MSNLPENNDDYGPFMQGRGGAVFTSAVTDIIDAQMRLSTVFPEGKVGYTINISSRPDGKIAMPASTGYTGGIMFPKIKTKTEDELSSIMKFFDLTGSDKNALIMRRGLEGKHYTIQDGKLVYTVEQLQKFREIDFPDADQIFPFNVTKPIPEMATDPLQQSITEDVDAYSGLLIPNQAQLYLSETLVKNGTSLTNILRDARMKYILGQLDLAGWKMAVEQWRSAGGAKAMEELTAAYKMNKK